MVYVFSLGVVFFVSVSVSFVSVSFYTVSISSDVMSFVSVSQLLAPKPSCPCHGDGKFVLAVVFAVADASACVVGFDDELRKRAIIYAGSPEACLQTVVGIVWGEHILLSVVVFVADEGYEAWHALVVDDGAQVEAYFSAVCHCLVCYGCYARIGRLVGQHGVLLAHHV